MRPGNRPRTRKICRGLRFSLLASTTSLALGLSHAPARAVVPNNNRSPEEIIDPRDVTGIGLLLIGNSEKGPATCTGSLMNPRTVIFAAHCVHADENDNPVDASRYGAQSGGISIGVGFRVDNFRGHYFWSRPTLADGTPNPFQYRSNPQDLFYNINQVAYHPERLSSGEFGRADLAVASLDMPAPDVPTWTLLFSALAAPGKIDPVAGTGYHVALSGYGISGSGSEGETLLDSRRRVAENMLGLLGSENDIYGEGGAQNLYWIDFDDPARSDPDDEDRFTDAPLEGEANLGRGDSGGPLILDRHFDEKTILGIASFITWPRGAPPASYGSTSAYTPIYLHWDWIAANNPYRYVANRPGDRDWFDPAHWVTKLDPNYRIIDSAGRLVNGVPTSPGAGALPDGKQFGQVCGKNNGVVECYDVATGITYVDGKSVSQTTPPSGSATGPALPPPSLDNGLPGATGFVPDNIDADPPRGQKARYFDVTLSAKGRTTLSDTAIVDRFTVAGGDAALDIGQGGYLGVWMDVNQFAGHVNVEGRIQTLRDYFLMSGLLSGAGTVSAPYLTSMAGTIAPGHLDTIGTLTIEGNLILASASALVVNLGPDGTSDRLDIVHDASPERSGMANLGGKIFVAPLDGNRMRDGDRYTVLTAAGGITGALEAGNSLSAILFPRLSYTANSVLVEIEAGRYADVIDTGSVVQRGFATLLDQDRVNYAGMASLYGELDMLDRPGIRTTLEAMAPSTEAVKTTLGLAASETNSRFYRNRLAVLGSGKLGGRLTVIGRPLSFAARGGNAGSSENILSDVSSATVAAAPGIRFREELSAFVSAGYIEGDGAAMAGTGSSGKDRFDGWFLAGGMEALTADDTTLGIGLSYIAGQGKARSARQADADVLQATLYGRRAFANGFALDAQFGAGVFRSNTRRQFSIGAQNYDLRGDEDALLMTAEVNLARAFEKGRISFTPKIGVRASHIGFGESRERGGDAALRIERAVHNSVQARLGVDAALTTGAFRPRFQLSHVHEFLDQPKYFGVDFVQGIGTSAPFALPGRDRNWFELGGGFTLSSGNVDLTLSVETTLARSDIAYRSYQASARVRF